MNIVLLGSPGAGKGTQATLLVKENGFAHISTGDIFRAELSNNTALGQKAKAYMDKGELVPDELVVDMVNGKISSLTDVSGVLLDGFPRNLSQAKAMEGKIPVDLVVYIHVDKDEIIRRLSSRRLCTSCGNIQSAKNGQSCDKCGGPVIQREDDTETVIMNRLNVYEEQTVPLIAFYQNQGKFVQIDGDRSVDEVYQDVSAAVERFS